MSSRHFVVSQRESWQFSYKGEIEAPFPSKKAAITAAIAAARELGEDDVEVLVRDGEMKTETVWRPGSGAVSEAESAELATEIERERDA
jgi:hypothetical protein